MGRRGPPPKPPELLRLANNPGHRRLERLQTEGYAPPLELPRPPRGLSKAESREYWRLGRVLLARGTICALDRGCLTMLACESVRWELIQRELAALPGEERIGELGRLLMRMADKAAAHVLSLSKAFGLTPASQGAVAPSGPARPARQGPAPRDRSGWQQFDPS